MGDLLELVGERLMVAHLAAPDARERAGEQGVALGLRLLVELRVRVDRGMLVVAEIPASSYPRVLRRALGVSRASVRPGVAARDRALVLPGPRLPLTRQRPEASVWSTGCRPR
jgi:hypothetical protein